MPQEIATDLIRTDEGALKVGTAETVCISEDEVEKVDLYETFANVNEIPAQLYKDQGCWRASRTSPMSMAIAWKTASRCPMRALSACVAMTSMTFWVTLLPAIGTVSRS